MPDASSHDGNLRDFERAICNLGLPVAATIADLTSLYEALARPSRQDSALRHLELEWLGAADAPRSPSSYPSRADLMHVISRSIGIESTEAFAISDLEQGMGYPPSQVQSLVRDGHLWAPDARALRFPRWQFTYGRNGLPTGFISDRLQIVVAAIPQNSNPALVRSIMTLSSPSFPRMRGREVSPREFLLTGGAPSAVAALLLRYLDAGAERFEEVATRVSEWA